MLTRGVGRVASPARQPGGPGILLRMPPDRRVRRVSAVLDRVAPVDDDAELGVELGFLPLRGRVVERIDDFADLDPALTVAAVDGLGKVLRILRAARIAYPEDPLALVGDATRAAGLLERALGTTLSLEVRPRSRLRFTAWTETGVETVEHVSDVLVSDEAYLVLRRGGRFPVRVPRDSVVRRVTETERWLEVVGVERR